MNRSGLKIIIICMIAMLVLLPGCSGKKDSAAKKPETSAQKKAPEEMKSILSDMEKIIASLGEKIAMAQKPEQQAAGLFPSDQKESSQGQGQGGQDKQSGQGEGQSNQNQEQMGEKQSDKASAKEQMNDWQTEETSLKNIHRYWNTLEPDAIKAGLCVSERNSFEQALDKLTLEISQQNKTGSLMSAIELYGQYAKLVRVFDMPIPPDFYETKYEVMAATAEAANNDWPKAQERVPDIKEGWDRFKYQAKVKDEKLMSKSDFSIDDLVQALESKQIDTLVIKAEIALTNMKKLEEELSSKGSTQ